MKSNWTLQWAGMTFNLVMTLASICRHGGPPGIIGSVMPNKMILSVTSPSALMCAMDCLRVDICSQSVYCKASGSCHLLEFFAGLNNLNGVNVTLGTDCELHQMRDRKDFPCYHGNRTCGGVCDCESGWTGFYCEQPSTGTYTVQTCQSVYKTFTNGTSQGDLALLRQHFLSSNAATFKVIATEANSRTVRVSSSIGVVSPVVWAQCLRAMDKQDATVFSNPLARRFEMYVSNGRRSVFSVELGGVVTYPVTESLSLEWLVCPRPVATSTTYANADRTGFLQSLAKGAELYQKNVDVIYFKPASLQLAIFDMGHASLTGTAFMPNPYWYIAKTTATYTHLLRMNMGTSAIISTAGLSFSGSWLMDEGWTPAFSAGPSGQVVSGSLDFLHNALLRGHQVRVTGGFLAARAQSVIIRNRDVVATLRPYIEPLDPSPFNSSSKRVAWTLLTSKGDIVTCSHVLETSSNWQMQQVSGQVSWFVDGRDWRRVLTTAPGGEVLAGCGETLYRKLEEGSTLRIGVLRKDEYELLEVESVDLGDDGSVTAEVTWVLRSSSAPLAPPCLQTSALISTKGGYSLLTYSPGLGGNVSSVTDWYYVDWFLQM